MTTMKFQSDRQNNGPKDLHILLPCLELVSLLDTKVSAATVEGGVLGKGADPGYADGQELQSWEKEGSRRVSQRDAQRHCHKP